MITFLLASLIHEGSHYKCQKGIQFFLFGGGEWVDLATFQRGIGDELDDVIPQLGPRQFIEGVLGKYQVEVAEVQRDVLFIIHRLGVLLESLHKPLGNRSGHADVFCLGGRVRLPRFGQLLQAVHLGSWLPGRETAWVSAQLHLPCRHLL